MANLKFEGEMEGFNELRLSLIRNVLEKHGFKNDLVNIEVVGKKGDNYGSIVRRIVVKNENKTFKMIAKVAPTNELIRGSINVATVFKNEITMYNEVLYMYEYLMNSKDLGKEERFRIPKCYGSITEAPNEIILLEDLQMSQFTMLDRFKPLSDENIKLVLKDLAISHSLSFVLKHNHPEKFNQIKVNLANMWSILNGSVNNFFLQFEENLIVIMHDYKHKNLLKGTLSQLSNVADKLFRYDLESKHSVIQQGDCWTNNILFRLEDEDAVESVMIDYQLSKIASPAADLLYLMFNCTDYQTRAKHYYEWLDYYHTHLGKSLDNFGLRVMQVYPRDQFDVDLRRCGKLGLILSIFVASVMVRESEEAVSIMERSQDSNPEEANIVSGVTKLNATTLERLKTKVRGCVDSAIEFGFI